MIDRVQRPRESSAVGAAVVDRWLQEAQYNQDCWSFVGTWVCTLASIARFLLLVCSSIYGYMFVSSYLNPIFACLFAAAPLTKYENEIYGISRLDAGIEFHAMFCFPSIQPTVPFLVVSFVAVSTNVSARKFSRQLLV